MVIPLVYKKRKLLNPDEDSTWIQTISSFNLRNKEFGEVSSWLKTTSGNTIDVIYFILSVPIGEEDAFLPMFRHRSNMFLMSPASESQMLQEGLSWITPRTFPRVGRVDLGGTVLTKVPQRRILFKKWCLKLRQRRL